MTAITMDRRRQLDLDHLDSVTLAELDQRAALQTRRDRKYVIPCDDLGELLYALRGDVQVLQIGRLRCFAYESMYFDTTSLRSYHSAARGRPRRYKVRTRTYVDTERTMFEVKERNGRQHTVKHRQPHPYDQRCQLTLDAQQFLAAFRPLIPDADRLDLRPVLATSYLRTTLFAPASGSRTTIDTTLTCQTSDGHRAGLPGVAIVETKSAGPATEADHHLWCAGHRPTKISKYATGLAAIRTDLPANRWSRVLAQHFGRTPAWASYYGLDPVATHAVDEAQA